MIFSNKNDVNSDSSSGPILCQDNTPQEVSATPANNPSSSVEAVGSAAQQNTSQPQQNNDKLQTYNSINSSNDCSLQQLQTQTSAQQQPPNNPLWWRENLNLDKSKLILIGFSKGCVVLNQVSPIQNGVKIVAFNSIF